MSLSCTQMEQMPGCLRRADGTKEGIIIHTEYGNNAAGSTIVHRTVYSDSSGVPITLAAGESVSPGCCERDDVVVTGNGTQIAGSVRAGTPEFNGAPDAFSTGAISGLLQSITILAVGVVDGLPGQTADQVIVIPPGGQQLALYNGESRTFSVVRTQDRELRRDYEVAASGNAYATITWTVV